MESYDEFARRARIITEVHALPARGSADCTGKLISQSAGGCLGTDAPKQSALQRKEKDAKKKSLKRL